MTVDTAIEILTVRRTCMECVMGNGSCEDCDHAFDMAINSLAERKTMTHEEAVGFLQESGWLQGHDKQIYEQGKRDGIEERKTGRWEFMGDCWRCSACGRYVYDNMTVDENGKGYDYRLCPACGAEMEGSEADAE